MSDRKRDEVENRLERKGFNKSNNDHRKFIYTTVNGKKTSVWTKTSHGSSHYKLSEDLLRKMAKQCHLSKSDFDRLLDCPMSREDYEMSLIQRGHININ